MTERDRPPASPPRDDDSPRNHGTAVATDEPCDAPSPPYEGSITGRSPERSLPSGSNRRPAPSQPVEERTRAQFFSMVRRQLGTLYRFVRHELAYRHDAGDLLRGELSAEDVVDAVLLRAYREHVIEPKSRRSSGWLIRLAQEQIDSDVGRLVEARETTSHVEEDVPETPPQEEVTTLGEEILYFYQPDEDLKLEDLIEDTTISTPEENAQADEQRSLVRSALAEMPAIERRALLLRQAEGLSVAELAEALGKPRREVKRLVEGAQEKVRRRLADGGYRTPSAFDTNARRGPVEFES
jgi:RNA polymerase sigma factor (sigma-70 family)